MTIALKLLAQAALTASAATAYTAPAGKTGILKSLLLSNTTAAEVAARVHLVPSGGSPSAANALVYDIPVPGTGIVALSHLVVIPAGYTLRASGLGITLTASGAEQ